MARCFCRECGALLEHGADDLTPTLSPPTGEHEQAADNAAPAKSQSPWGNPAVQAIAVIALIALIAVVGLAVLGRGGDDPHAATDASADAHSTTTLVTQYGCEIRPIKGFEDSTEVFPQYCTEAHVISDVCGWALDDILVPPTSPTINVYRYNTSTSAVALLYFDRDDQSAQFTAVDLSCNSLDGTTSQHWTIEEWNALHAPA